MLMVRMFRNGLTNLRMYGSKRRIGRNAYVAISVSVWGRVRIYAMKIPIVL